MDRRRADWMHDHLQHCGPPSRTSSASAARRRAALNRLRADLEHYRTPSDIDDLLASVDGEDTPEAEMIRSILSENLRSYHSRRSA